MAPADDPGATVPRSIRSGTAAAGAALNAADSLRTQDLGVNLGPAFLDAYLAGNLAALVGLRRQVHAHPELSRNESATSALILGSLHARGIKAELMRSGTGVVAEIGSGDRLVGTSYGWRFWCSAGMR